MKKFSSQKRVHLVFFILLFSIIAGLIFSNFLEAKKKILAPTSQNQTKAQEMQKVTAVSPAMPGSSPCIPPKR
ncbi:MAG: hypothetical protein IPJ69_06585 [Deltaproteobacteria bacterium]|nr:MAG: hypothetical protein IPJ69_06585 [Deltaproteobacteria bacterium]